MRRLFVPARLARAAALQGVAAAGATVSGAFAGAVGVAGAAAAAAAIAGTLSVSGAGSPAVAVTTVTLAFGAGGSQPWTIGQLFRKGDAPSAQPITASAAQFQADVRTRWDDGSARFAVLSGVSPAGAVTINRGGTPYVAGDVGEPNVAAVVAFSAVVDSVGATVAGGAFSADIATARVNGAGAWSRTTARRVRQILGPVMSEFHYFVPTADDHTHVWFYVRAYATGQVEVETVVENGWVNVGAPGQRTYTTAVTIGGAQRYSGSGIAHHHHTRWSRVDWVGTDPLATPQHDVAYVQSTNGVPTLAVRTLSATAYTTRPDVGTKHNAYTLDLAERPAPFALGNVGSQLGAGGENDYYGVVPGWAMTYLAEGNSGAWMATVASARGCGAHCLHYRSEDDGRPFRSSSNLALVIGYSSSLAGLSEVDGIGGGEVSIPAPSGVPVHKWAYSHSPAAYFAAAIMTGRWQFCEGVNFVNSCGELAQGSTWGGYRTPGFWEQNRAQGWKARDRFQGEFVTASEFRGAPVSGADLAQRNEAVGRVESMIDMNYDYYVSGSSTAAPACARGNIFGIPYQNADAVVISGSNADGEHCYGGLMTGFYILPWLYGFDIEPSIGGAARSKLQALAEFFGKWPIGMLGAAPGSTTWNWRVCTFVTIGWGKPGAVTAGGDAGGNTVYRASWDAQYAALQSDPAYTWQPGTWPAPTSGNDILKIRYNENTGAPALMLDPKTTLTADTDIAAFMWCANYAHKIADRATLGGADLAITRLHGATIWTEGKANMMLVRPEFAVTTDRVASASALGQFAATVSAGSSARFTGADASLAAIDSTGTNTRPWEARNGGSVVGSLDWCSNLPYDTMLGRFLVGGGRPSSLASAQKLIYYDLAQNKWDAVGAPWSFGGHLYQSNCNAESIRRYFFRRYESGPSYNIDVWNTSSWSSDGQIPSPPSFNGSANMGEGVCLIWMPNMGTQGKLLACGSNGSVWRCCAFDWANRGAGTAAWSLVFDVANTSPSAGTLYGHFAGIYVPGADVALFGASDAVEQPLYCVRSSGTHFQTSQPPSGALISAADERGILAPHPSAAAAIFFSYVTQRVYSLAINAGAGTATWTDRGAAPAGFNVQQMIGGTIPELGIVVSAWGGGTELASTMYVYRPNF